MKIRHILLLPALALGLMLLLVVLTRISVEVRHLRDERQLTASNAVRQELLLVAAALASERTATYLSLRDPEIVSDLEGEREAVDITSTALTRTLRAVEDVLPQARAAIDEAARLLDVLQAARKQVATSRLSADEGERLRASRVWFETISGIVEQTQALRLSLLRQDIRQDPIIRTEGRLRYFGSILSETISQSEALIAASLKETQTTPPWVIERVERNFGRSGLANDLIAAEQAMLLEDGQRRPIEPLAQDYLEALSAVVADLRQPARDRRVAMSGEDWVRTSERALAQINGFQQFFLASSRDRLASQLRYVRASLLFWLAVMGIGLLAVALTVVAVRNRVAAPLEKMIAAMERLAHNDLRTPLPQLRHQDEFAAMSDALQVFKKNAIRRETLQHNRNRMLARLKETYRTLREDLRAAAAIQTTLLPRAATIGDVGYSGLYLPASVVAGDTFNVLDQEQGRVGFFQVDVAGHGAPAALGSVVSHHTLSQFLLKKKQPGRLAQIAAEIHRDWPQDLPYFTMILGEVDMGCDTISLVQAGHPSPILVRAGEASPSALGDGGFPVGLVPEADYDVLTVPFGRGDRLLIYSDGVIEATDPAGHAFGGESLEEIVRQNTTAPADQLLAAIMSRLRAWRHGAGFEDDVSMLIVERTRIEGRLNHAQV
ncbi:PP2C family protein-serine/threonine phosphatase [Aurantimonas sp. HBX-1]|uniref:PP2C family protein-serine/threonine phosphatase n=1 Tax=Aurantimonas sp. HBX-1 TaxID=2906072 RepID=UPI001F365B24|nr:SpoIIE family protein phosphatase [Aurantimonas sp. HBX-1]UIJ70429.1 SpoIIE family protein phosphatase [Aurantimonas sp. HBX-1]